MTCGLCWKLAGCNRHSCLVAWDHCNAHSGRSHLISKHTHRHIIRRRGLPNALAPQFTVVPQQQSWQLRPRALLETTRIFHDATLVQTMIAKKRPHKQRPPDVRQTICLRQWWPPMRWILICSYYIHAVGLRFSSANQSGHILLPLVDLLRYVA